MAAEKPTNTIQLQPSSSKLETQQSQPVFKQTFNLQKAKILRPAPSQSTYFTMHREKPGDVYMHPVLKWNKQTTSTSDSRRKKKKIQGCKRKQGSGSPVNQADNPNEGIVKQKVYQTIEVKSPQTQKQRKTVFSNTKRTNSASNVTPKPGSFSAFIFNGKLERVLRHALTQDRQDLLWECKKMKSAGDNQTHPWVELTCQKPVSQFDIYGMSGPLKKHQQANSLPKSNEGSFMSSPYGPNVPNRKPRPTQVDLSSPSNSSSVYETLTATDLPPLLSQQKTQRNSGRAKSFQANQAKTEQPPPVRESNIITRSLQSLPKRNQRQIHSSFQERRLSIKKEPAVIDLSRQTSVQESDLMVLRAKTQQNFYHAKSQDSSQLCPTDNRPGNFDKETRQKLYVKLMVNAPKDQFKLLEQIRRKLQILTRKNQRFVTTQAHSQEPSIMGAKSGGHSNSQVTFLLPRKSDTNPTQVLQMNEMKV